MAWWWLEAGELGEEEAAELITYWHGEFERANKPGFSYCQGSGAWLDGAAAREAHYRWADIPRCLLEKWAAGPRKRKAPREKTTGRAVGGFEVVE